MDKEEENANYANKTVVEPLNVADFQPKHDLEWYLHAISTGGDRYGRGGGVLDLLEWCGKNNTQQLQLKEVFQFYKNHNRHFTDK